MTRMHARATEPVAPAADEAVDHALAAERTRWAMHVHDGLTQAVTSAVLELRGLRRLIVTDPDAAVAVIDAVESEIRADLRDIRAVLLELDEGEIRREPPFASFVGDLSRRWKLPADLSLEGDVDDVEPAVLETAHAVIAEALANAAKHSGSADVAVRVRSDRGSMRVEVEDRGRGLQPPADEDPHFGMRMMRTRAEDIGGSIEIRSTPGGGTRVVALLPVGGRGEER
jgi:two-component system NarL family sensor kinase